MTVLALAAAIVLEVAGTLSLRMASRSNRLWFALVALLYPASFAMLFVTLRLGMTIGVAYGIWTACGVVLTAIAGWLLFRERITWVMGLGFCLIVGGVILVELGAHA